MMSKISDNYNLSNYFSYTLIIILALIVFFCGDRIPTNPYDPAVKLNSPRPIHPIGNIHIPTNLPTFIWTSIKGAEGYEFIAANNSDFQDPLIKELTAASDTVFTVTDGLNDGQYYWKVRVINRSDWSILERFVVDTHPPTVPVLLSPIDSLATNSGILIFDWVDNAEVEFYCFQIDKNCDFLDPAINDSSLHTSEYSMSMSISDGVYYWRVCAFDKAHNPSQWSNSRLFIVDSTIPNLMFPDNGTISNNNKPSFTWNTIHDVMEFQFQLSKSINFDELEVDKNSFNAYEFHIEQPCEDGCYYWRVRSKNIYGLWMNWSKVNTFTIDTAGPEPPNLLNPLDKANLMDTTPTFEWQAGHDIEEYHIQIGKDITFSTVIISQLGIKTTLFQSTMQFEIGSFFWRLKAKDRAGNWGNWSSPMQFTIDRLKWKYQATGSITSSPAIGIDGSIYFGSYDRYFYAVSPNGSLNWKSYSSSNPITSSPLVSPDGGIYFSCNNSVYAYDSDGSLRWTFTARGQRTLIYNTMSVDKNGILYVCLYDYSPHYSTLLYAFYPDGRIKWRFIIAETYMESFIYPKINLDGTIFIGDAGKGQILIINSDGTLNRNIDIGLEMNQDFSINANGFIFFGSRDQHIYSYKLDGTQRWKYLTSDRVHSVPAIGMDGTIYVGSDDNWIYALGDDGSCKWKYKTNGQIVSSPVIGSDGIVYIGSMDGFMYALNSKGDLMWKYDVHSPILSSPAISDDGTLLFGSGYSTPYPEYLYALRCSSKGIMNSSWPKFLRDNQNTSRF